MHPAAPLLWSVGAADHLEKATRAFSIGTIRTFDQDPRFGLCVLTEIAERALSPAVNDPGTAIDILGRAVRVLSLWTDRGEVQLSFPLLWVPPIAGI